MFNNFIVPIEFLNILKIQVKEVILIFRFDDRSVQSLRQLKSGQLKSNCGMMF